MTVPLSVLDLSPVPAGGTAGDALRNSIDLARAAERAGYHRFWVAEHHLNTGVASASAPVLVGLLAAATERIRVGSGAVQMPNTRPLQVAEQLGTVAAVHPGRVDVGLGRYDLHKILRLIEAGRVGGDLSLFGALGALLGFHADDPPPDYREQVADVLSYFDATAQGPDGTPLHVLPAEGADVEFVVLGTGAGLSAQVAGELGLPFAAGYHVAPLSAPDAVTAYRAAFRPGRVPRPHVLVSADVVVAADDATARELAAPYGQWVLDIRTGRGARPYVTPAEARGREWTDAERAGVADRVDTQLVGSPGTVADRLQSLARATGADELLITTITTEHADRVRSHELLAAEWAARSAVPGPRGRLGGTLGARADDVDEVTMAVQANVTPQPEPDDEPPPLPPQRTAPDLPDEEIPDLVEHDPPPLPADEIPPPPHPAPAPDPDRGHRPPAPPTDEV